MDILFFRIIKHPMKPKLSHKVTSAIICFIYLLSISATLPFTFMLNVVNDGRTTRYYINYDVYVKSSWMTNMVVFWTTILFVTTLLPTAILSFVYFSASTALQKSLVVMDRSMQWKKRIVRNRKVNRMFIVAVVCFFITVTPYTTYSVFISLLIKYKISFIHSNVNWLNWLDLVLQTIMTFNSCINPFVYCKMHKEVASFMSKKMLAIKTIRPR